MLTNRGTCTIRTEPLAEPIGELRWLASCDVCGREYHTATEDPSQHWPPHLPVYLPPGEMRKKLAIATPAAVVASDACPYLGDKLGAIRTVCTGCGGTKIVPVPVFACGLFGTCTERPATGETFVELSIDHRACAGCPRIKAEPLP